MIVSENAKSLESQVYLRLEEEISSGELCHGKVLTENELSARLGVSRTPVRAALRRLCEEGLVEISPNRGATVIGVSTHDLIDTYEIRMRLEGLASSLAAERISPDEKARLTEAVEMSEYYINKKDFEHIKELDTEFHSIIYEASGSRMLCRILKELHRNIRRYRKLSLSVPGRLEQSIEEHREIYRAIISGCKEDAERLTSLHIERALNNLTAEMQKGM